jgi:anti-anti-sigma factor
MTAVPASTPVPRFGIGVTICQDRARLAVAGEIDPTNADLVRLRACYYLDESQIADVVADLSGVTFLDSYGLRALVLCRRYADELGKTFVVRNHRGPVAKVVEATGLTRYLTDPAYRPQPRHRTESPRRAA